MPERAEALMLGRREQFAHLLARKREHLRVRDARRPNEPTDVAREEAVDLGIAERAAEDAVSMTGRARRGAMLEHPRVHLREVGGGELRQGDVADSRDEVNAHELRVADPRR